MKLTAALWCLSAATSAAAAQGAAVDLPYPRCSGPPTGQAGPIFVVSQASISAQPDQATLGTLAGVIARHSPVSTRHNLHHSLISMIISRAVD